MNMTLALNPSDVDNRNNTESLHQNRVVAISDNGTVIIEKTIQNSLESSLNPLVTHDHDMLERPKIDSVSSFGSSSSAFTSFRRRIDSVESFASASSAFSLVPKTSHASQLFRHSTSIFRKNEHPKGIILHPQTQGRPIVEFKFDFNDEEIPDYLLVPIL
mmetsp:Transcript_13855/g.32302  ORF Transcript_13855/g.32302 Transcript_13855/m.32302 type:complete len:160 (-) Transcript_13855:145-624(-)